MPLPFIPPAASVPLWPVVKLAGSIPLLAGGGSLTDALSRKIVMPRGALSTVLNTADAPAGQRRTLVSSRVLSPFPSLQISGTDGLYVAFWAGYVDGVNGEKGLPNAVTFRAGFEANSQCKQMTFSGASSISSAASAAYGADGLVISDPIYPADVGLANWPTTGNAYVRLDVTCPSSGQIPGWSLNSGSGEACVASADVGSYQSGSTGALTTPSGGIASGTFGPGPAAIIGKWASKALPAVAILGDSIGDGLNDTTDNGTGQNGGFSVRAVRSRGFPYVKLTCGGDAYASIEVTSRWAIRKYLARFADIVIDEFGINGSATAAQQQTDAYLYYAVARQSGVSRIIKTKVTPSGSSSNSFVDKAGQSPFQSNGGSIDQLNAAMLAAVGSPTGPTAFVDVRTPLADGTDDHYWLTNGAANYPTSDGVHPSPALHTLAAVPLLANLNTIGPVIYAASPFYQDLTFAGFTAARATKALNALLSPEEVVTAAQLTEDGTTGADHNALLASAGTSSGARVATIYAKRVVGSRDIQFCVFDTGFASFAGVKVSLADGSITEAAFGFTAFSLVSAVVTAGPEGFWKIALSFTSTSQTLRPQVFMLSGTSNSYNGDGASSIALWGLDIR